MLNFGTAEDILCDHFRIGEDNRSKFRARLKQLQRMGFPDGINVGRAVNAKYGPTQIFQLAFALEMISFGMTPERATENTRRWWDEFRAALLAAQISERPICCFLLGNDMGFFGEQGAKSEHANSRANSLWRTVSAPNPNDAHALDEAIALIDSIALMDREFGISMTTLLHSLTDAIAKIVENPSTFWEEVSEWQNVVDRFDRPLSQFAGDQ